MKTHAQTFDNFANTTLPEGELFMFMCYQCKDGTIVAKSKNSNEILVDDVIAFLQQFRGKLFWNGAAGDTCFIIEPNSNIVSTDSFRWWLEEHSTIDEEEANEADYVLRGDNVDTDELQKF